MRVATAPLVDLLNINTLKPQPLAALQNAMNVVDNDDDDDEGLTDSDCTTTGTVLSTEVKSLRTFKSRKRSNNSQVDGKSQVLLSPPLV